MLIDVNPEFVTMPKLSSDVSPNEGLQNTPKRDRILRQTKVLEITGLSRTTIWRKVRANQFPKPIEISDNALGWWESEIMEHLANCPRRGTSRDEAS